MKRIIFLLILLAMPFAFADFEFNGTTYNGNGTVVLTGANITVTVVNLTAGYEEIGEVSALSNGSGFFTMTLPEHPGQIAYGPNLFLDNSSHYYAGKPLPEFFATEFDGLSPVDFFLKPANKVNVSVINATGSTVPFNYQVKDQTLGFPINEDMEEHCDEAIFYLQSDRNYSIMVYPNRTMPRSNDLNSLTPFGDSKIEFNTSEELLWISGYAKLNNGSADFDDLYIVPFLLEPGNMIFPEFSSMPQDMSSWRGGMPPTYEDVFNETTGFYNITLPAVPAPGIDIMLMFIAEDYGEDETYGFFQNLTFTMGGSDVSDFNVTLYPYVGEADANISQENRTGGTVGIPTVEVNFSIRNESGNAIQSGSFISLEFDYSAIGGTTFSLLRDIEQSDLGYFTLPVLENVSVDAQVFSPGLAPREQAISTARLANDDPLIINVSSFSPGGIDGSFSDIFIDMIKHTPECSVPNYNATECSLMPNGEVNFTSFNPLKVVMGGGEINFVMGKSSNRVTVIYENADLLASGPPDVLFDGEANQSAGLNAVQEAWRFGSEGPEIYSSVLIGMPYDVNFDPATIKAHIAELYDESWNVIWQTSDGVGNLPDEYSDFTDMDPTYFNDTAGMQCSASDANMTSNNCYIDADNSMLWMRIPHFSGTGPEIAGNDNTTPYVNYNETNLASANVSDSVLISTNWTEQSLNSSNMTCVLMVNGVEMDNASSIGSWCNFTYVVNVSDYSSVVFVVNATDMYGNNNVSGEMNVTVTDNVPPAPYYDQGTPSQGATVSDEIVINVSANDSMSGVDTILIFIDDVLNRTCTGLNNCNVTINTTIYVSSSVHNYSVVVNDTAGNTNSSLELRNFTVNNSDSVAPVVNYNETNVSSAAAGEPIYISTNWSDSSIGENLTCVLFINGTQESAFNSSTSWCNFTYEVTSADYPLLRVRVNASDNFSNEGQSGEMNVTVTDNVPPAPYYDQGTPSDGATVSDEIVINVSANDSMSGVDTILIYIDDVLNVTCTGVNNCNATINTTIFVDLSVHNYSVIVNDTVGNTNSSLEMRNFTVDNSDSTAPVVNYNETNVSSAAVGESVYISTNWSDSSIEGGLSCVLFINGTQESTLNSSTSWCNFTYEVTSADYPLLRFRVNASDNLSNEGQSDEMNVSVTDSTPPSASYATGVPADGANISGNFTLGVSASDAVSGLDTITIFVDGAVNTTCNASPCTLVINTSAHTDNSTINFSVSANDTAGNDVNLTNRLITVDNEVPKVIDVTSSSVTSSSAVITANASDLYSGLTCEVNAGTGLMSMQLSDGLYEATLTGLSASNSYTATVECTDGAGNSASNETSFTTSSSGTGGSSSGGSFPGADYGVNEGVTGQFAKRIWASIFPEETARIEVKKGDLGVTSVEFRVSKTAWGAWIEIKKHDSISFEGPDAKVYGFVEIKKGVTLIDIIDSEVNFKVTKEWMIKNNVEKSDIFLYRYTNMKWEKLDTKIVSDDSGYVYFSAKTPGFSFFSIAAREAEGVVEEEIAEKEDTPKSEVEVTKDTETEISKEAVSYWVSYWGWIAAAIGVLVIIGGYFAYKKWS